MGHVGQVGRVGQVGQVGQVGPGLRGQRPLRRGLAVARLQGSRAEADRGASATVERRWSHDDGYAPGSGRGVHLVLYDGVCGLCNFACQFILARDRAGIFDFASLQSATGRAWLERFNRPTQSLDTFCLVTDYQTAPVMLDKSDAARPC